MEAQSRMPTQDLSRSEADALSWLREDWELDVDDVSSPAVPKLTPRYDVCSQIGAGGMARVYDALDTRLNRRIAVKVASDGDASALARFRVEARVTGRLDHPNVLPVYDMGIDQSGVPFFTMKMVRNHQTLRDLIETLSEGDALTHQRYSFQRRVALVQEIARALSFTQRAGILHRDIKPANVVIGPNGEVYLADWGLAFDPQQPLAEDEDTLVGTPQYMAPELFGGAEADPRSEAYSLCALLYELLTLRSHLGPVDSVQGILEAHQRDPEWADRFRNPISGRVPRALARICGKGLARDPQARYPSAAELAADLQRWLDGRAQVFCAGTFLQRTLGAWSRLIDEHTYAGPLLSYTVIGVMVGCGVNVVLRNLGG